MNASVRILSTLLWIWLGACASKPVAPPPPAPPVLPTGSIYGMGASKPLFEDATARRIGDVLTVLLTESTTAQNAISNSTNRESTIGLEGPTLLGRPVTAGGVPILETDVGASAGFSGGGTSAQSNRLQGSISVRVTEVLPDGALRISGRKEITLARGAESVMLDGIVRLQDIRSDNTVTSDRIADARIAYKTRGAAADAGAVGWLARFFSSALFPF